MSATKNQRRKRKPIWLMIGLLSAVCLGLFLYQLFGPHSELIVSQETTFITEPLRADGWPDYGAYWLELTSSGVTPENNAALLFWQAMWPGDLAEEDRLPLARALGIEPLPTGKESLVPVYQPEVLARIAAVFDESYTAPSGTDPQRWQERLRDETAREVVEEAMQRPWTSEQISALGLWVEQNQAPLDLLVRAAARPRYFSPPPNFRADEDFGGQLFAMLMPDIQGMREAVRALSVRAMYHLGAGRHRAAWQDLRACHRLARRVAEHPTLVGQLVAIAMHGQACHQTQVLLSDDALSADLARQIFQEIQALQPIPAIAKSIDQGERILFLDAVLHMTSGKQELGGLCEPEGACGVVAIDRNRVLRIGNRWYDRLAAATRITGRADRLQELKRIDSDIKKLSRVTGSTWEMLRTFVSRRQRSNYVANIMVGLFLPEISWTYEAADRCEMVNEMTITAAALALYRSRYGDYPEQLDALVPGILSTIPLDFYAGQPLIYQRQDDGGYLLYSVFSDGTDGGGTSEHGEIVRGEWQNKKSDDFSAQPTDKDLVIRLPVPQFKMPDPPTVDP